MADFIATSYLLLPLFVLLFAVLVLWFYYQKVKIELKYQRGMRKIAEDSYKELDKMYGDLKQHYYAALDHLAELETEQE